MPKGRSVAEFRCPKCGATTALSLPVAEAGAQDVALRCLACAHITRLPRDQIAGLGGDNASTG